MPHHLKKEVPGEDFKIAVESEMFNAAYELARFRKKQKRIHVLNVETSPKSKHRALDARPNITKSIVNGGLNGALKTRQKKCATELTQLVE